MEMTEWIDQLASSSPTPGGGGASALAGALASALCSMVANLTIGKKTYAAYQTELTEILEKSKELRIRLLELVQEDADAFAPLAAAYRIPKEDPGREEVIEPALVNAANAPMNMLKCLYDLPPLLEELERKGSKLAISDVGCAASLCKAAAESAFLNVAVNTKLMKQETVARQMYLEAEQLKETIQNASLQIEKRVEGLYEL